MALEGDQGDRYSAEPVWRRLRPITPEYASDNVPRIVLLLKRRQLQVTRRFSPENLPIFHLSRLRHLEDKWTLLESDFLRVKDVARQVDVSLFPSEDVTAVLARIRARVRVEWPG